MEFIKDLVSNKVILSALFSWFLAQFLKVMIEIFKRKKLKAKEFILRAFFGTGGMPSSHSAAVTSVSISIGIQEGFASAIFALSLLFFLIVVRDATGVRLSAGHQAVAINDIIKKVDTDKGIKPVKEVRGHTPLECFVGVLVGILVSLGLYFIK